MLRLWSFGGIYSLVKKTLKNRSFSNEFHNSKAYFLSCSRHFPYRTQHHNNKPTEAVFSRWRLQVLKGMMICSINQDLPYLPYLPQTVWRPLREQEVASSIDCFNFSTFKHPQYIVSLISDIQSVSVTVYLLTRQYLTLLNHPYEPPLVGRNSCTCWVAGSCQIHPWMVCPTWRYKGRY